jgi:hypothetical protein
MLDTMRTMPLPSLLAAGSLEEISAKKVFQRLVPSKQMDGEAPHSSGMVAR